jgi:hypothetical protein
MLAIFDFENGANTKLATNLGKTILRCEYCGANQNKKNAELKQTTLVSIMNTKNLKAC